MNNDNIYYTSCFDNVEIYGQTFISEGVLDFILLKSDPDRNYLWSVTDGGYKEAFSHSLFIMTLMETRNLLK